MVKARGAVVASELDANRAGFGYLETYSVPYFADSELLYILTACTEVPQHTPDIAMAYARQISLAGDNLFILRENLSIVACEVDHDSLFHKDNARDQQLLDVIHEEDASILRRAINISRENSSRSARLELRVQRRNGIARMAATVTYVPGRKERWILSTRPTSPLGGRIIDRMRIAWGVETYADLARAMGMDRSALSRYRRRDSVPADWLILTYLRCRVSVHWLYTGHGPRTIHGP